MPVRKAVFGKSFRPRFLFLKSQAEKEASRVLVGNRAHDLTNVVDALHHSFLIKPGSVVVFNKRIASNVVSVGEGVHGKIFFVKPEACRSLGLKGFSHGLMLKVYKRAYGLQLTDGITQYASTFSLYNFLKKQKLKSIFLRAPPVFAAGKDFLVTRAINAPTAFALKSYFENPAGFAKFVESDGHKEFFDLRKVPAFIAAHNITPGMISRAYAELDNVMLFKGPQKQRRFFSGSDLREANVFVHGTKDGRLVISFIDQGNYPISNVLQLLEDEKTVELAKKAVKKRQQ